MSNDRADHIQPGMTLVIDGQHHIVDAVRVDDAVYVDAETVIGNMGPRSFRFEPSDRVTVLP